MPSRLSFSSLQKPRFLPWPGEALVAVSAAPKGAATIRKYEISISWCIIIYLIYDIYVYIDIDIDIDI